MSVAVYTIDPLEDPRWEALVVAHPRASVFHSRGWLEALHLTYGYRPFVLTTTEAGPLTNGLAACEVRTAFARRLVSLPFSDHADVLADDPADVATLCDALAERGRVGGWRSVEVRAESIRRGLPLRSRRACPTVNPSRSRRACPTVSDHQADPLTLAPGATYAWHVLDLRRSLDAVFEGFHPSSTRRAIRRAEREGVVVEAGQSDGLLAEFFALLRLTRRRHGVPPQPVTWFRTLVTTLRERLTVYVARKARTPIAAILTLGFRDTLVYKYGGSDARHHAMGGMPLLFWAAIKQAHAEGKTVLDLGRSNLDQPGLITFKDHLGAEERSLTYTQWPAPTPGRSGASSITAFTRRMVSRLPDPLFDLTGRLAYRHLG